MAGDPAGGAASSAASLPDVLVDLSAQRAPSDLHTARPRIEQRPDRAVCRLSSTVPQQHQVGRGRSRQDMSIAAINWAMEQKTDGPSAQSVLFIIADRASEFGVCRHADPDTIAEKTR